MQKQTFIWEKMLTHTEAQYINLHCFKIGIDHDQNLYMSSYIINAYLLFIIKLLHFFGSHIVPLPRISINIILILSKIIYFFSCIMQIKFEKKLQIDRDELQHSMKTLLCRIIRNYCPNVSMFAVCELLLENGIFKVTFQYAIYSEDFSHIHFSINFDGGKRDHLKANPFDK